MKIYTKTGDKGKTGLIGGTRVSKDDIRIEAYGTVDELNSYIGMLTTYEIGEDCINNLQQIQHKLFSLGAHLATDRTRTEYAAIAIISENDILFLENEMDRLEQFLPELKNFILPGGHRAATVAHLCRTVARRAERRIIEMSTVYQIENECIIYTNRLSDYFFVLSRYINILFKKQEILWKN